MQDRDETYREIEASLGISSISIHSILHEHLVVKIPHNLTIVKKRLMSISVKKCWKNATAVLQKTLLRSSELTNHGNVYAYEPKTKQQSTVWVFEDEPNPTKVVRGRSSSKQVACFFSKTGHIATVPLEQCCRINSEQYNTIIGDIRKTNKKR